MSAFFGAVSFSAPATIYMGLSGIAPVDVSNFGPSVTYGSTSLTDSTGPFLGLIPLAGAYVVTSTGKVGTVLSNTAGFIQLIGAWTGGTPSAGEQYDVVLFNEPNGNGYTRIGFSNNTTNLSLLPAQYISGAFMSVNPAINFPVPTGSGWGHIVSAFLADSATIGVGHILVAQPLAIPQNVLGGQIMTVPANQFSIGLS